MTRLKGEGLLTLLFTPLALLLPIAVNVTHISFITSNPKATRIRFGEGRSVTVAEPY